MKQLSCGILVLNDRAELLMCHVTGAWHWDIPKGGAEADEAPQAAALRETREECGLVLSGVDLLDLGRQAYQRSKDLHLYAVRVQAFDATLCHCSSRYTDSWGRQRDEMDGFEWTPFDRVVRRSARHLGELLTQTVSLPALLARLQHSGPAATSPRLLPRRMA
ncbi:NUDIX hydrolase [Aquabacterium sp. OR-4]|uniref:NUDIX hydrolase n=1 Tax=Aquabacterium sp. OR-4 TaxID=2978127 RepID=UPI0021B1B743|nr:NUDIX hydrolase [Aquabacterium sp. OR-4]MDT7837695.1 NUDIX hydrolase [Aquabacterium sp. OR-4]